MYIYSNFIIYIRVRGVRAAVRAARQTPPEAAHSAAGVGVGITRIQPRV